MPSPELDRWQLGKALLATAALLVMFGTALPHEIGVLLIAGAMLISRQLGSRDMIGMVDWHLLVLFACLFSINFALKQTGLPADAVADLASAGLLPDSLAVMAPLSVLASNTIGNVPAVVLLLAVWHQPPEGALYGLALLSTLAGKSADPRQSRQYHRGRAGTGHGCAPRLHGACPLRHSHDTDVLGVCLSLVVGIRAYAPAVVKAELFISQVRDESINRTVQYWSKYCSYFGVILLLA